MNPDTANGILEEAIQELEQFHTWILSCFMLFYQFTSYSFQKMLCYLRFVPCIVRSGITSDQNKQLGQRVEAIYEDHNLSTAVVASNSDCINNWCLITDYIHYWQHKIYSGWCYITGCLKQPGNVDSKTILIPDEELTTVEPNGKLNVFGLEINEKFLFTFVSLATLIALGYLYAQRKTRKRLQQEEDIQNLIEDVEDLREIHENFKQELRNATEETDTHNQQLRQELDTIRNDLSFHDDTLSNLKVAINGISKLQSTIEAVANLQNNLRENGWLMQQLQIEIQEIRDQFREFQEKVIDFQTTAKLENDKYVSNTLANIANISAKTNELERRIETFIGTKEDKEYLNIHELLLRNIINLDNIQSNDNDLIKTARREAVGYVNICFTLLEERVRQQ